MAKKEEPDPVGRRRPPITRRSAPQVVPPTPRVGWPRFKRKRREGPWMQAELDQLKTMEGRIDTVVAKRLNRFIDDVRQKAAEWRIRLRRQEPWFRHLRRGPRAIGRKRP
jgi:hypothetical protein